LHKNKLIFILNLACRFQTPGEMDFNTSKKFSKTPSGNISKKKLASRVKANDFIKKQMVRLKNIK